MNHSENSPLLQPAGGQKDYLAASKSSAKSPGPSPSQIDVFLHRFSALSADESGEFDDGEAQLFPSSKPRQASSRASKTSAPAQPPAERQSEAPLFSSNNAKLLIYLFASVGIAAANAITWKRLLNKFHAVDGSQHNLEFFVSQFTVFLYVIMAGVILAYRWICTNAITEQQKQFPQRKFALMGFLDSSAGVAGSIGGGCTSGQLQTVINQLNIVTTMGLSYFLLRMSYRSTQYIGAFLILLGTIIAAFPPGGSGEESSGTAWYGPMILIISCIPNSFSNVYKEENFKQDGLDVYFLTTVVSFYQVLIGFLFFPLLAIPGFGGIPMHEIPHNFLDGWKCFLGQELSAYECHLSPSPSSLLFLYVGVNFFYNVLLLLITKHGSALLLVIASAISLPITNIIFTMPFFMGSDAEEFSWSNMFGLGFVVVGFLFYSLVANKETGEFMPVQGAAGQNLYVTESAPILVRRPRSRSFDVTHSPAWAMQVQKRRELAGVSSKAKEVEHFTFSLNSSV